MATIKEKCQEESHGPDLRLRRTLLCRGGRQHPRSAARHSSGLQNYKIDVGTPFFVKYGRVGVMDEISEITGAEVTCTLIGERPGPHHR